MMNVARYLRPSLTEYIHRKIILIMGPRQVGKTTLAKGLAKSLAYYNYDNKEDLRVFTHQEWDRGRSLVVFDELHKKKNWKLWLKGIFDSVGVERQNIVVTGSARLDVAKKVGDSLAGRFFSYRLHPFDLKELKGTQSLETNYQKLIHFSGFPEPLFEGNEKFYGLWKKTHSDLILRQDLLSLEVIRDLDSLELLIELLSMQVGSTVSYKSLAEDLQKDEKTIKVWLRHLENLYVVFRIEPFATNVSRGIKKAGKYYFYDVARVRGKTSEQTEAARLENLVALSLKKEIDFQSDTEGRSFALHFIKLRDQREVDFAIVKDKKVIRLIEVKLGDSSPSASLKVIGRNFEQAEQIQLVRKLTREFSTPEGLRVTRALDYLAELKL
ncbi:MAG: AAA family ATPase [Bdellovibrionaceae bacterium]|nr:AAA family ATPase [Pseudobdellovibrionaceae bacterium]